MKVYIAPMQRPSVWTLQADYDTWKVLASRLTDRDFAIKITRQITGMREHPLIPVNLTEAQAQTILDLASN